MGDAFTSTTRPVWASKPQRESRTERKVPDTSIGVTHGFSRDDNRILLMRSHENDRADGNSEESTGGASVGPPGVLPNEA